MKLIKIKTTKTRGSGTFSHPSLLPVVEATLRTPWSQTTSSAPPSPACPQCDPNPKKFNPKRKLNTTFQA